MTKETVFLEVSRDEVVEDLMFCVSKLTGYVSNTKKAEILNGENYLKSIETLKNLSYDGITQEELDTIYLNNHYNRKLGKSNNITELELATYLSGQGVEGLILGDFVVTILRLKSMLQEIEKGNKVYLGAETEVQGVISTSKIENHLVFVETGVEEEEIKYNMYMHKLYSGLSKEVKETLLNDEANKKSVTLNLNKLEERAVKELGSLQAYLAETKLQTALTEQAKFKFFKEYVTGEITKDGKVEIDKMLDRALKLGYSMHEAKSHVVKISTSVRLLNNLDNGKKVYKKV